MTRPQRKPAAGHDLDAYPTPTVAVDVVLLSVIDGALRCLVVRRDAEPFAGMWALPGSILRLDETLEHAAGRALAEKAAVDTKGLFLEQLYTFGTPDRDPRRRVLSVAYYALVPAHLVPSPETLAHVSVPWDGETGGPVRLVAPGSARRLSTAFDHEDIVGLAVQRIRGKLAYTTIGFELLPPVFPLRSLQAIHEAILGRALNKDSFRRRVLQSGLVHDSGRRETGVTYRPARLYRFAHDDTTSTSPPEEQ